MLYFLTLVAFLPHACIAYGVAMLFGSTMPLAYALISYGVGLLSILIRLNNRHD